MEENFEDDVPPLEDMSEYFKSTKKDSNPLKSSEVKRDSSLLDLESDRLPLHSDLMIVRNNDTAEKKQISSTSPQPVVSKYNDSASKFGFGGMKKGFLGNSSKSKSSSKEKFVSKSSPQEVSHNEMPYLKRKANNLQLDEVQDEMKKSFPLLSSKDWVTEDLLGQFEKNPVLSKGFSDPKFTKVLEDFHRNPQEAMKFAQSDPQVQQFLQEFCNVMGNHFTSIADEKDKELSITEHLSEEDQRMKEALTRPEVQAVLRDTEIQHLIELLKDNAEEAQRFLESNKNSQFHAKVRLLIEHGVLNVQKK